MVWSGILQRQVSERRAAELVLRPEMNLIYLNELAALKREPFLRQVNQHDLQVWSCGLCFSALLSSNLLHVGSCSRVRKVRLSPHSPQDRRCIPQGRPANLISRWWLPLNINSLHWGRLEHITSYSKGKVRIQDMEKKKIRYIRSTSLTLMQLCLLVTSPTLGPKAPWRLCRLPP